MTDTIPCPVVTSFNDGDLLRIVLSHLGMYARAAGIDSPYGRPGLLPTMRVYTEDDKVLHCEVTISETSLGGNSARVSVSGKLRLGQASMPEPPSEHPLMTVRYPQWITEFHLYVSDGRIDGSPHYYEPKVI